jgi:phenylpyruvate tautomerase PptA (4-oxalocrotonate tautomerase family)
MPLIEITVSQGTLTSDEKLRLTKAVQKALVEEYKAMKNRIPHSWVVVREFDRGSLLIDGMTIKEIVAQAEQK